MKNLATHEVGGMRRGPHRDVDEVIVSAFMRLPRVNVTPVLAYHEVGPPLRGADPAMAISPKSFARHVRWLADAGFVGITVSEWLDARAGRIAGPSNPVLITFDDGYAGVGENALPVLLEHGFSATVFIVTQKLGCENDWDAHLPGERRSLMSEEDVRSWARAGIEVGAHTRTHARLGTVSASVARDEIEGSHADLTDLLGSPPRSFAYPYGTVNAELRGIVSTLFEAAFTADEGANRAQSDVLRLRRSGALEADSRADLALRMRLGWTPRHRVLLRLRRRYGRTRRRLAGTRG